MTALESEAEVKVVLDRAKCTGIGICESLASGTFEIDDDGELVLLQEEVAPDDLADVEAAVLQCPTEALRLDRA